MNLIGDLIFLAVAGFLLGSFISLARVSIRLEPWAKVGYAVVGAGLVIVNIVQLWLQFHVDASHWFLIMAALGYAVIASGLILLARSRKANKDRR